LTYRMRRFVQSHIDEVFVNFGVCIGLLVVGVLGLPDLRERVSGWISENLLFDLVELGRIIEHVHGIKISVRLEQVIAPGSLREVSNATRQMRSQKN
jgi:hypothetical protein